MLDPQAERLPHVLRKRARRVRAILRTAAEVFAERGYDRANLEEIAARLEMRGPSLYHYFKSKDDLLLACIQVTAEEVMARARRIAAGEQSARTRLERLFREQVLIQVRDYPEFVPLFLRLYVPEGPIRDRVLELRREHGAIFDGVLSEGVASGEFEPGGWRESLLLAVGALSYLQEWYRADGRLGPEEMADVVAARLLRLFKRPQPPPPGTGSARPAARGSAT